MGVGGARWMEVKEDNWDDCKKINIEKMKKFKKDFFCCIFSKISMVDIFMNCLSLFKIYLPLE